MRGNWPEHRVQSHPDSKRSCYSRRGGTSHLFDPSPQAIVPVRGRRDSRGIAGGEFLDLRQTVLRIIRVLSIVPGSEQGLLDQIPVVVILVAKVAIRRQLIAWVHDTSACGSISHRVIGKVLWIQQQRMARTGEAIQLVIAKRLRASAVRQTGPIAHRVVDVVGLVDLRTGGRELMQDVRHLTRRIVSIGGLDPLGWIMAMRMEQANPQSTS